MFRQTLATIAAVLSLALGGCATAPVASESLDAAAKTFATKPDKANIYVYRNESMGAAVGMDVQLDGKPVGTTGAQTYLLLEVAPGKHTLVSSAENESRLELNTEAGRNYFVWQEVKMGVMRARTLLQQVDERVGRAGVQECKLLARPTP